MTDKYYQDKIAIVTGGGQGLGRSLCLVLAARGAVVHACDIDMDTVTETATISAEKKLAGEILPHKTDVSKEKSLGALIDKVMRRHGKLDIIFNNAAVNFIGEMRDLKTSEWQKIIKVNFNGMMNGSIIAYKKMLPRRSGQIVNISSPAGILAFPTTGPYSAVKAGVNSLSLALRTEAARLGIKVNTVMPGMIATPVYKDANMRGISAEDYKKLLPKAMSADKAAEKILKGAAKDQALIIFPFSLRLSLFLMKFLPFIGKIVRDRTIKRFRRYRKDLKEKQTAPE